MIQQIALLTFMLFFSAACARPDYVEARELPVNKKEDKASCSYPLKKLNICLIPEWESAPDATKYNSMVLHLEGSLDRNFDELTAILWMPSMGHGSSPVKIEKIATNRYRIYDMYFVMRGEWEVRIGFKAQGQTLDEIYIPVVL